MNQLDQLQNIRHSCAHLLAAAVKQLWPNAKNAIGPAIEHGFYQDFDMGDVKLSAEDFIKIEVKMKELLKTWHAFEVKEVSINQAKQDFANNPYKLELIEEFAKQGKTLTENDPGNFLDLCKGGHANNPQKEMQYFKLLTVAGAYWRGDEKNKMLTRIYGTCFSNQVELDNYLAQLEEAKQRDHRKLGKELDLFTFSELVGAGLPLFTPRGTIMRRELEGYISELRERRGFQRVWIPHMAKVDLYKTSGHWDKFEDDLFHVRSKKTDTAFVLKPMNCPHHTQIFASQKRSYKDMPIRFFENTTIYRDENTGQIQGLTRVRSITQDDSHVFARPDQIQQEAELAQGIITELYATVGMELRLRFSTHDPAHMENYLGSEASWQKSENALKAVMESKGLAYTIGLGEAAFYGPKIDYMAVDCLGREWQLATIQLDVNQPERFGLSYTNAEGKEDQPVMIHVAVMGSVERFMGVIIEHFAGNFPTWLAPVQVQLLTVTDKHVAYCMNLAQQLKAAGIRVAIDSDSETIGKKIRKATQQKIPYVLVIGDKEIEAGQLAIRKRGEKDTVNMATDQFIKYVQEKVAKKDLSL